MADPGWYADPSGLHDRRYWDGARWTEYVDDAPDRRVEGAGIGVGVDAGEQAPGGAGHDEQHLGGRRPLVGAGSSSTGSGSTVTGGGRGVEMHPAGFDPTPETVSRAEDGHWTLSRPNEPRLDPRWSDLREPETQPAASSWPDDAHAQPELAPPEPDRPEPAQHEPAQPEPDRPERPQPEGVPVTARTTGVAPFRPRDFTGELPIVELREPPAAPGRLSTAARTLVLTILAASIAGAHAGGLALLFGADTPTVAAIAAGVSGFGLVGSVLCAARVRPRTRKALRSGPVDPARSDPEAWLDATVAELADAIGIRPPAVEVYLADSLDLVTAASGRNRSLLALSTGSVRRLNGHEVRGLLAHGVARIARGDAASSALIAGVGDTLVTGPSELAASVVQTILGRGGRTTKRIVELVLQLTIGFGPQLVAAVDGRRRIGNIDAHAAELVGADSVVSTLLLVRDDEHDPELSRRLSAMAIRPSGVRAVLERPLATHPDTSLRIAALE